MKHPPAVQLAVTPPGDPRTLMTEVAIMPDLYQASAVPSLVMAHALAEACNRVHRELFPNEKPVRFAFSAR